MADPFIGEVRVFAASYVPRDWVLCDGQLMSTSQYPALFAVIGGNYGGDWRTTFAVPNLMAKAPMHWGRGIGLQVRAFASKGGDNEVTLAVAHLPQHDHVAYGAGMAADSTVGSNTAYLANRNSAGTTINSYASPSATGGDRAMASAALASAGGSQSHENRQPFLVFNFGMATDGYYPPRS